jgi:hypothetical protein
MRRTDFCPRDYKVSVELGFRPPFDMPMPGIMFNLDRFQKALVDAHYAKKGNLPKWLGSLGCVEPVSFPAKLTQEMPDLGLTLVGMPDYVLRHKDGSLCVIDFKTAKFKGANDPFMPVYEAQLWGYAQLLEHNDIGEVRKAALVYFANDLADHADDPLDLLTRDGLTVPFTVNIHQVKIDLGQLGKLITRFKSFVDLPDLPEGNEHCKTCARLDCLFEIERAFSGRKERIKALQNRDSLTLNRILCTQEKWRRERLIESSMQRERDLEEEYRENHDSVPGKFDL